MALPKCECDKPITLCDRLNCAQSTFIDKSTQMTPNDKLLPQDINKQAEYYSGFNENEDHTPISKGKYYGYIAGATAWAPWKVRHDELRAQLLHKDFCIGQLQQIIDADKGHYEKLQAQAQRMADALEALLNMMPKGDGLRYFHAKEEVIAGRQLLQQFKDGGKEVSDEL